MLLNVKEYAQKHGYNRKTVLYWCGMGLLKGAVKVETGKKGNAGLIWMIPEETRLERKYHKWKPKPKPKKTLEAKGAEFPLKSLVTQHDKSEYIKQHCVDRTYRQLCKETGMSMAEIRRVYDRLHEVYGI